MATLLFLLIHALKDLNSVYDCYWVTLLLALDSQLVFRYWLWKQSSR